MTSAKLNKIDEISEDQYPPALTKEQELNLRLMFNQNQVQDYFAKVQTNNHTSSDALQLAGLMYGDQSIRKVTFDIQKGSELVPDKSRNINNYITKEKITEQEKKAIQLRIKREQIVRQLEYLEAQTSLGSKKSNPQLLETYRPPNILSKQEHEKTVQAMLKNRDQLDKRHEKNITKLEKSRNQQKQRLTKLKIQKIQKQKKKRRDKIEKSLQLKKSQHQKILQMEKQSQKKYEEIKHKKFLHEKIQEKYHSEVVIPALEEKKRKLKEIREFSRNFNINQILEHQKQYIDKRNQSLSMVKSKVNEDWNYKAPEKTEKLARFLEQEKTAQRIKLLENKRKIDEKINRQQNFINYLREKFVPRVDHKKQRQIQMRIQKDKHKRRQSESDSKILGISYLEEAKRLAARKTIDRPQTQRNTTQNTSQTTKKQYTNYLTTIDHNKEYYQARRRKRLEKLINSEEAQSEKLKKLNRETQKIHEQLNRRQELKRFQNKSQKNNVQDQDQDVELLLSGIQAKMGIINIFKQNHQ